MKTDAMKKSQSLVLVAIIAGVTKFIGNLRIWAEHCIPVGYEDESGFHVGVER